MCSKGKETKLQASPIKELFTASESESRSVVSNAATPWSIQFMDSPGQNTRIGSLSLLQGIFPTKGSKKHIIFIYPKIIVFNRLFQKLKHEYLIYQKLYVNQKFYPSWLYKDH